MSTLGTNTRIHPSRSIFQWLGDHWFGAFLVIYGLWVFVPFLAPLFMNLGWTGIGRATYFFYSFFCHQLPERSFFFYGEQIMYPLSDIQSAWQDTANPMILRQFIGNETMGWKVAWSDRMISFYTSVWVFAALWYPFRHKIKTLSWWGFILLLLPMALDGGTHMPQPKPSSKPRRSKLDSQRAKHLPPFAQPNLTCNRPAVDPPPGQQRHNDGQQDDQDNDRDDQVNAAPQRLCRQPPHGTALPRPPHTALARNRARITG